MYTRSLTLGLLLLLAVVADAQQSNIPNFQAPPGYNTKVESVHQTFNFYGLTRTILLPWERLPLIESSIPKGNSLSTVFKSSSKVAEKLYNDPAKTLPSFGTPSRQAFQAFKGKEGDGLILYFEYKNVLPKDAKEQLSMLFFNTATPPDPNTSKAVEQFLVNDHTVIVWCFKNIKSRVKEAHQKQTFDMISDVATQQDKNKKK